MQQSEFAIPLQTQCMVQVQPGMVPQVPPFLNLPGHLYNYTGQAIFVLIANIQSAASTNDLRRVFFNRVSQNGYNNTIFQDLCFKLAFILDIASRAYQADPGQVIDQIVPQFLTYKVCQMGATDQHLAQQLPPDVFQACQMGCASFEQQASQWESVAQQRMNPGAGLQPNNVRNFPGAMQQQQAPMMPNNYPSTIAPGQVGRGYSNPNNVGGVPSRYGNNTPVDNSPAPVPRWHAQPTRPSEQPVVASYRPTPTLDIAGGGSLTSFQQAEANLTTLTQPIAVVPAVQAAPAAQTPESNSMKPAVAYDPNLFDLVLDSAKRHYVLTKRNDVDRQKHLFRPVHAPVWITPPTIGEAEKREEESIKRNGDKIIFVDSGDSTRSAVCARLDEVWNELQVKSQAAQAKPSIEVNTLMAVEVKGVSAGEPARQYLGELRQVDDLVRMGTLISSALSNFRGRDQLLFGELNDRLTEGVNFTLSCEMGVKASISDFGADIADLIAGLNNAYGAGTVQTFIAQSVKIIKTAMAYISEDGQEARENIRSGYFQQLSDAEFSDLVMFDNVTLLCSVNVSSAELRLAFEDSSIGNSVFESHVPLAYSIIDACMKRKEAEAVHRVMLRTVDGVRFYLSRSAFNPSGYQVQLFK